MKLLTFLLIFISLKAHSNCSHLVNDSGGWSAHGMPGLTEVFFNSDNSFNIYYSTLISGEATVVESSGIWKCTNSIVNLNTNLITHKAPPVLIIS